MESVPEMEEVDDVVEDIAPETFPEEVEEIPQPPPLKRSTKLKPRSVVRRKGSIKLRPRSIVKRKNSIGSGRSSLQVITSS